MNNKLPTTEILCGEWSFSYDKITSPGYLLSRGCMSNTQIIWSNCKLRTLVSFIITSADKNLAILHGFVLKHRWYKPTYTSHNINNNEAYRQKTNTPLSQIISTPFVNLSVREGHFWFCYSSSAESYSYLIGVTTAQFRRHLSSKNAVCDIWITFW